MTIFKEEIITAYKHYVELYNRFVEQEAAEFSIDDECPICAIINTAEIEPPGTYCCYSRECEVCGKEEYWA